ncbi:MAG: integrase [Candidatus Azotimanducaceae bacterium]|jgi:integrase
MTGLHSEWTQAASDELLGLWPRGAFIKSRLGYDIEIFDDYGDFRPVIKLPDDTGEFVYLKSQYLNLMSFELREIARSYLRYILERYHTSTVRVKFKFLDLFAREISKGVHVNEFLDGIFVLEAKEKAACISACKEFLRFLLLCGYEDLSLEKYEEFLKLRNYTAKGNSYLALFVMDDVRGPFTREEISVLSDEVNRQSLPLEFRLVLDLCLCFGLRPIQISLLRRKDLIRDNKNGISYLNIPRVKQSSRDRRVQFSSRILTERTAALIQSYIDSAPSPSEIDPMELPIFINPNAIFLERDGNALGSHYWDDTERSSSDYFSDESKRAVLYQKTRCKINYILWGNEHRLPLSPRTGKRFTLCAYRFRYTVGTQAVMSGCSPEELADLLDHNDANSIKHYFRFTHEMWEILENATLNRIEQKQFTAAWMREGDLKNNIYSHVCEPKNFNVIGKCAASSICFEEPAVACYSCDRFCPNKNVAAHESALEGLVERKDHLLTVSTANVVSVIDQAIAGCRAAIAYSEGHDIVLINAKEV